MIQIKHRYTNAVLFESEAVDIRDCLLRALKSGSDLSGCDLSGSDLHGCDLSGCNLRGCNFSGCNLRGCNLSGCNLHGCDLSDCNLRGCNFSGCNFSGCDLSGSDLSGSDLVYFKTDFFYVLLRAQKEITGLREHLISGNVDGSFYQGECACLLGTIANVRNCDYQAIGNGISPNSSRPAEQWFMSIKKGDTPETNQISKITVEWIDEFVGLLELAKS